MKILKFYSDKCAPCIALSKFIETSNTEGIEIVSIDIKVDDNYDKYSAKYSFKYVPHMVEVDEEENKIQSWDFMGFRRFLQNRNSEIKEYKNPELIATVSGQGFYKKVKGHPNWEKVKNYFKNK